MQRVALVAKGVTAKWTRAKRDREEKRGHHQGADIDSLGPFGDVIISLLANIAKLEREKIRERTLAGLARARKQGRTLGRPAKADDHKLVQRVQKLREDGVSIRQIATQAEISPNTVLKLLATA